MHADKVKRIAKLSEALSEATNCEPAEIIDALVGVALDEEDASEVKEYLEQWT
jgi:hypothetical protein